MIPTEVEVVMAILTAAAAAVVVDTTMIDPDLVSVITMEAIAVEEEEQEEEEVEVPTHSINTSYQHPINTFFQHTPLTQLINTPYGKVVVLAVVAAVVVAVVVVNVSLLRKEIAHVAILANSPMVVVEVEEAEEVGGDTAAVVVGDMEVEVVAMAHLRVSNRRSTKKACVHIHRFEISELTRYVL